MMVMVMCYNMIFNGPLCLGVWNKTERPEWKVKSNWLYQKHDLCGLYYSTLYRL